jgi:2-polyprenyl-6-hydroxyphenyl methylase/3-demethylubiquinone-9 3-methyltransferase
MSHSIDPQEIAKFSALAEQWWDEEGPFKPLHQLNPVRIAYIKNLLCHHYGRNALASEALKGLSLVDIGCGGGLLSIPLARLGADVTGIDASEKNIAIARYHADHVQVPVCYRSCSAESLAEEALQFDMVLAMEVIEHVADVPSFIAACTALVKPGGLICIATLNRTPKSYLYAIIGAEYVLRLLPKGTHDWHKFLKPSEIAAHLRPHGMQVNAIQGVGLHWLRHQWELCQDTGVNYMLVAEKVQP